MQGMGADMFPDSFNVVVNTNHPLISSKLLKTKTDERKEALAKYLYDLALLNQNMLKGADLSKFVTRSLDFLN